MGLLTSFVTIGAVFFGGWNLTIMISGLFGLGSLFISGLLASAYVSVDHTRTNVSTEQPHDRKKNRHLAFQLFLFGAPHLLVAIITLLITR